MRLSGIISKANNIVQGFALTFSDNSFDSASNIRLKKYTMNMCLIKIHTTIYKPSKGIQRRGWVTIKTFVAALY